VLRPIYVKSGRELHRVRLTNDEGMGKMIGLVLTMAVVGMTTVAIVAIVYSRPFVGSVKQGGFEARMETTNGGLTNVK